MVSVLKSPPYSQCLFVELLTTLGRERQFGGSSLGFLFQGVVLALILTFWCLS